MDHVAVLALPGVVLFDLAIPLQVFGRADLADRYAVRTVALGRGGVESAEGVPITVESGEEALGEADMVVVPGFFPHDRTVDARALDTLCAAARRGARVISICTGAFALAAAGLLDGRRATTHWHHTSELAARFPAVDVDPDVLYVDEGDLATSAGLAAGIDLCLALVRRDHGADCAADVARRLVVAPHRDGGQAQLLDRPLPAVGDPLADTCAWARGRLADDLSVADLARRSGLAPRTFARHFRAQTGMTPLQWITAQRVHEARRLLERTDLTVADIARRTGLGSATNLRKLVARDTRTTPSAYRRAYQGNPAADRP
jgi:transcriptional regulator GlxA family with amidase domain